jgi:hypothetical protein
MEYVLDRMDIPPQQKKSECDIDYCPGVAEKASFPCEVCEAAIHPTCFYAIIRKLPESPTSCHDEIFCSPVCCTCSKPAEIGGNQTKIEIDLQQNLMEWEFLRSTVVAVRDGCELVFRMLQ